MPESKIGKINSIRDFFKDFILDKSEDLTDLEPGLRPYYETATCKLCGEKLTGLSPLGAVQYCIYDKPLLFDDKLKHHLEIHKLIIDLNLKK